MERFSEQRLSLADFHQAAKIEHCGAVAQPAHCSKIMGDEQIGDAQTPLQITQQVENFGSYRYIECRGRLIENNKVGLGRNRAGDSDSLQLTGTHLMRIQADTGSVKTNQVEQMFPRACCSRAPIVLVSRIGSRMASPIRWRGSMLSNGSWNTI